MTEAVLFDIDNTLILFDENAFFKSYIARITPKFSDILPPEVFLDRLIEATRSLLDNQGQRSNAEHYMNHFSRDCANLKTEFWKRFEAFYAREFNQLGSMVKVVKDCRQLLNKISSRGIRLVAASNPLWPHSVQVTRLAWAGVDDLPYSLVTGIENSSFCKPQPEFYREISRKIGMEPERCLMVGNDPLNDMIAGAIGMKTYLATDSHALGFTSLALSSTIRRAGQHRLPEPDFTGPLSDVIKVLEPGPPKSPSLN
jgi:FMN phosphatase YigB (HAD superfamily)